MECATSLTCTSVSDLEASLSPQEHNNKKKDKKRAKEKQ